MPSNPRVRAVQNLRRSNAAGPHGTGRRPVPDLAQEIADAADEARTAPRRSAQFSPEETAAWEAEGSPMADTAHQLIDLETDYGTRFRCSCGEVSPYYTSRDAAREMHAEHVNPGPRSPGTTAEA